MKRIVLRQDGLVLCTAWYAAVNIFLDSAAVHFPERERDSSQRYQKEDILACCCCRIYCTRMRHTPTAPKLHARVSLQELWVGRAIHLFLCDDTILTFCYARELR